MARQVVMIAVIGVMAIFAVAPMAGCDRQDSADKQGRPIPAQVEAAATKELSKEPVSTQSSPGGIGVPLGDIQVPEGTPDGEWLEIGGDTPLLWCYRGGKHLVFEQAGPKVYLSIDDKPFFLAGIIVRSKEEALLLNREAKTAGQPLAVWVYGPKLYLLAMVPNPAKIISVHVWEFGESPPYEYEEATARDLSPLERLSSLSSLSLRDCTNVRDIDALKSLKNLTSLDLSGCSVTVKSIASLAHLPNLRALNLVYAFAPLANHKYDYSVFKSLRELRSLKLCPDSRGDADALADTLSHLRSLTDLTIKNKTDLTLVKHLSSLRSLTVLPIGRVDDLRPLAGLKNLSRLRILGANSPLDLAPIKGLSGLTELHLRLEYSYKKSAPTDLGPIGALKQLRVLSIETPQGIENLSAVGGLPPLKSLTLAADNLTDISALSGLAKLRSLDLSNNRRIKDISALQKLSALHSLRLAMCEELTDLSPLGQLKDLVSLDCSETSVEDLAPLSEMRGLRQLRLDWCPVNDISPLSKLTQMTHLSLARCPVTDLRPLATMHGLVKLDLSWPVSPSLHLPQSERLDIMMQVSPVKDVSPLADLRQLRHLNLYNCIHASHLESLDLPALECLHLPSHISDQEFRVLIERHRNLTELHIRDNTPIPLRQRDSWKFSLQPLSKLTRLRTLSLHEMNDLSPLRSLRSLTSLSLVMRTSTSTQPLSALTQLRKLALSRWQEEMDMSFTANLFNLFDLYVHLARRSELISLIPLLHRGVRLSGILAPLDEELRDLWRKELMDR